MTKLSVEEILNIPQLSFYLEPQDFSFFAQKTKDFEVIANVYNAEKVDAMLSVNSSLDLSQLDSIEGNTDSMLTGTYGNAMKTVLIKNSKLVNKDSLLLLLGGLAQKYFLDIKQQKKGSEFSEIVYSNGDIIIGKNGKLIKKTVNGPEEMPVQELRESLIEGALIVTRELQDNLKKNKNTSIRGYYTGRGIHAKPETLSFDLKQLDSFCKSKDVFEVLSVEKIKDLYNKKLYTYSDIVKAASNGSIKRENALMLYKNGTLKKDDILRRVLKVNDFETLLKKKDESPDFKFLIYGIGEVGINSIERNLKTTNGRKEKRISEKTFEACANFFDDKRIGELLTHGVLDYDESKDFLRVLVKKEVISQEKSLYFEKMMEDFKCDELLNQVESEELEKNGENSRRPNYRSGLTIDPKLRLDYLRSIGTVKRVRINGELAFSDDNSKNKKKYNSLDGYELLIIPDKRIAVLEKFYEVTRDKQGHMVYKTDKNGNYIPATEHATYVLPVGIAKQLVESKNKKDLISSKYVHRTFHRMGWVQNLQSSMRKINPEIEFDDKSTELWAKRIEKSYEDNRKARGLED